MAKFKCVEVMTEDEEALIADKKPVPRELKLERKRVLVPLDDGAKASHACQAAIDLGVYKPKPGEDIEEMKKKNWKREHEAFKKGKGLPT